MADRFPLIANTGHSQIQELPSGDNLNLSNNSIVGVGTVTATSFVGDGSALTGVASTDNIRTNTNATFLQNVNVSGTVTATSYSGSGANLTSLPAANLTGTLPAISGANLTGISAGMTLVGVTTIAPGITTVTAIDFTGLDPDSFYHVNGFLRLQSNGAQFLARGQFRELGGTFYDFGGYSAYEFSTKTMNTDYGNQSSSEWYVYNNYTPPQEYWFDATFSTHVYPWIRINYGGADNGYTTTWASGTGVFYNNMSTTRMEGIRFYNNSSYYYQSPTRVHLYKLQTVV
tara:strand:- start:239 stop:1099 length:861 start_codon:yes stop_codon:yes gene_type:complete